MRVTARLLLLAVSVTTVGPVLHGVHDADCDPVVVLHDERQHHFAALSDEDGSGAEHCVACHFVRSSRGPASRETRAPQAAVAGALRRASDGQLPAAIGGSPQPSRAPPLV